jgi:hypothetical protein
MIIMDSVEYRREATTPCIQKPVLVLASQLRDRKPLRQIRRGYRHPQKENTERHERKLEHQEDDQGIIVF